MTIHTPKNMPKTAMIMAAGFGMRMRPLTETTPKPLVEVCDTPLIDYSLEFLAHSGISKIIVNSHYLAEQLEAHLRSKDGYPAIHISHEDTVLETGGGIKNALPLLGDSPFFVINSDVICVNGKTPALHRLWHHWNDKKMDALLLLHDTKKAIGYHGKGDFFLDEGNALHRRTDHGNAPFVFTGIQILHPRLFHDSPDGMFSLNVLYNKNLKRIGGIVHDGEWLHVGSHAELEEAETRLLR